MNILAFDIETVPDVALGRKLFGFEDVSDSDVAKAMAFRQLQRQGSDFLPLYQHKVVAISVVLGGSKDLKIWSLGSPSSGEAELVQRFFDGLEKYLPELVSWNGSGFDLPVLHYRSLLHGISSARYWETGDEDHSFRYNNYLSRFHWRHIDLMDVLSGFQPRAKASLDNVAVMLGFPGKLGMKGEQVWDFYQQGEIEKIRSYCETDVLNTYLIFLRFQSIRGLLDKRQVQSEYERVRDALAVSEASHLKEFLSAWGRP